MEWKSNAEHLFMEGNLQYHIQCRDGDINKYVLLPGDPERVDIIAENWEEKKFIASHREYRTFSGKYSGTALSACSTGIGGPSAAIAIEELSELGADTFIRIGTCGAINEKINCGDLIICTGAMRQEGTSEDYIDISYPAMADYRIVAALIKACKKFGKKYYAGITCTTASFHLGQARPGFHAYTQSGLENKIKDLQRAGVLCFEMETATILTLAGVYGLRAGSVLAVVADRNKNKFVYSGIEDSIIIANEAVKILAEEDVFYGL